MEPDAQLAAELVGLPSRDEYLQAASELLLSLIPSEHAAWNYVDALAGQSDVRAYPDDHPGVDIPKMLLDLFAEHPVVISFQREPGDGLRRLSDLVSDRQLYRTRAYREGLSQLEVNRQLVFRTSPDSSGYSFRGWSMNRWGRDFNDAEVELARHVQPVLRLLEQSYDSGGLPEASASRYDLTPREGEILQFLERGLTGVAVGHLLGISPRTVAKHLEHAYTKLGCTNRIDALRLLHGG